MDLAPHYATLHHLTRTDRDPHVRHRADGLLLLAGGLSVRQAAQVLGCARNSLRTWGQRFLAEGRDGLADPGRRGRPPKLDAAARQLLETALTQSPLDYNYPVTTWTVADLADLLGRSGYRVHRVTVYRALQAMGYRYRRPRHDLTHRQDAEAVVSAKHALAELQKRGRLPGLAFAWSTSMNVISIPTPTRQRSGSGAGTP
jgi:transposase